MFYLLELGCHLSCVYLLFHDFKEDISAEEKSTAGFPELRKIMNRVVAWPQSPQCVLLVSMVCWVFGKLYVSWLQGILMCQFKNSARFPKVIVSSC